MVLPHINYTSKVETIGIEGDRAEAQAREEAKDKTVRRTVLRESVDKAFDTLGTPKAGKRLPISET